MDDMMKKMMMAKMGKKDDNLDPKTEAKLEVLKELKEMAMEAMGEDMSRYKDMDMEDEMMDCEMPEGMEKVTVAAPDKEGLMEGLDKAEDLLEEMPEDMADMLKKKKKKDEEEED